MKFYLLLRSTDGNIRDCLLLICAFVITDVTQSIVLLFVQNLQKNNNFGFSVAFSCKIVQISIFKVEYLENGLADFNDYDLILQDFERPFKWNQLVLALQFSFNVKNSSSVPTFCNFSENSYFWIQIKVAQKQLATESFFILVDIFQYFRETSNLFLPSSLPANRGYNPSNTTMFGHFWPKTAPSDSLAQQFLWKNRKKWNSWAVISIG